MGWSIWSIKDSSMREWKFSNESTGIYFLYPRNFIIKLLSGGFSQRGIQSAGD
jgi:hypothetical protein